MLDGGARARVKPGTVLGHANRVLAPHGYKLGPDPASTDIACVGGVIANNSGGMRCGVTHDSYQTVRALTFVLPSGTVIDSAAAGAEQRFAEAEPELAAGLLEIRDEILADAELAERIRRKFEIKNTTGYRLCAFLDAETPLEIFRRLLVGSEGTLAFIAEAVFETVPQPARTTVSWLHFPSVDAAIEPVQDFVGRGRPRGRADGRPGADRRRAQHPRHARLLARSSTRSTPRCWSSSAAPTTPSSTPPRRGAAKVLAGHELIREPDFHRDAETIEVYWRCARACTGWSARCACPAPR